MAEPHELVRAERVWIVLARRIRQRRHVVDPEVRASRPRGCRSGAVAPIVAVREAAARPADGTGWQSAHVIGQRLSDPAGVGYPRTLTNPHAVVHDAAKVFDEVPVVIGSYRPDRLANQHVNPRVSGPRGSRRERQPGRCGPGNPKEITSAECIHAGEHTRRRQNGDTHSSSQLRKDCECPDPRVPLSDSPSRHYKVVGGRQILGPSPDDFSIFHEIPGGFWGPAWHTS